MPYQGLGLGRWGLQTLNGTLGKISMVGDIYSHNDDVIEQTEVNATEKSRIIQVNYLLLMIHSCTFALKVKTAGPLVEATRVKGFITFYTLGKISNLKLIEA